MINRPIQLILLALALSGCSWLAPQYQRPAFDMPEQWHAAENAGESTRKPVQEWWQEFQDPVLQNLVAEALANNDDLSQVGARLREAQAQYDYAAANQLPLLTVAGVASHARSDLSNTALFKDASADFGFAGGILSYELDLWGKMASASQAAKAAFLAASYNRDAIRLSVTAGAAQLYFHLLALDADIRITRETIVSREESYKLVKKQYEHQAVNGLVLKQSEAELAATRAQLPRLLEQQDKAESALAVLLGRSPREIIEVGITRGKGIDALPVPPLLPAELPSDLLSRRPDIAAAEQVLIAGNFNIGVARAAYFPTISLSSLLGVSNVDVQNIYNGTVRTWQMGASLLGPVLDFGRTESGVNLAEAKNQEQLAAYKKAVRSAFKEVKDALSAQAHSREEEQAQAEAEKAVAEALRIATVRFSSGYSSYIEVLDAERNLYRAQVSLIAAKLNRLNASVNLCKALGGGWVQETL